MKQILFSKLVSIIVPIFNSEKYIRRCIASVLEQSYSNFELILVDDGSTDASQLISEEYATRDNRIRVIHQENQGVSAARNAGIEASSGEYLMFVDSDDTLKNHAIMTLVEDAEHYGADVVSTIESKIDENGVEKVFSEDNSLYIYTGLNPLKMSLNYNKHTYSLHGKLFKFDFVDDIRFVNGRNINEDGYYIFQCYSKCPVLVQHNISTYCYFFRNDSLSRSIFSEKYFDMLYFSEQKKKTIQTRFPWLINEALNMEVSTHLFFLGALCKASGKKYRRVEKESIQFVRANYKNYHSDNKYETRMSKIVYWGLFPLYKFFLKVFRYAVFFKVKSRLHCRT